MGYYPYATYLLPHFPDFRPASRPSSFNPSAYWYENCDFHPAGIWTVILLICNCYSVVKSLRLFRACVKHKTKLDACTYPEKTNFVSLVFFVVWISLCVIIISCFARAENGQGWCILMDLHQKLVVFSYRLRSLFKTSVFLTIPPFILLIFLLILILFLLICPVAISSS